jgi:hypothetical protein
MMRALNLNLPVIVVVVAAIVIVVGRLSRRTPVAIAGFALLALAAILFLVRSR